YLLFFFFFQAEDGIRDRNVTGVQTCALPILGSSVVAGADVDPAAEGDVLLGVLGRLRRRDLERERAFERLDREIAVDAAAQEPRQAMRQRPRRRQVLQRRAGRGSEQARVYADLAGFDVAAQPGEKGQPGVDAGKVRQGEVGCR